MHTIKKINTFIIVDRQFKSDYLLNFMFLKFFMFNFIISHFSIALFFFSRFYSSRSCLSVKTYYATYQLNNKFIEIKMFLTLYETNKIAESYSFFEQTLLHRNLNLLCNYEDTR